MKSFASVIIDILHIIYLPLGDGRLTLSTASISATILKDDDEEMQSQSRSSVKLRRTSSTEDGRDRRDNQRQSLYSEGEAGLSLTGTNDTSYGQGDSASAKKKKTLTRRLSSFFSKSFRRKSKDSSRPVSTFGTPQVTKRLHSFFPSV